MPLPFEVVGDDGNTYMHYDHWHSWRGDQCRQSPVPEDRRRYDVELAHPQEFLSMVPVDRNPHMPSFGPRSCFYSCDAWSTVFGIYDAHHPAGKSYRFVVESGHDGDTLPGERVRLMSTSSRLESSPFEHNAPNRFAYFRNQYWRVTNFEPLQDWRPDQFYPFSNLSAVFTYHPRAIPPDLLWRQTLLAAHQGGHAVAKQDTVPDTPVMASLLSSGAPIFLGRVNAAHWQHQCDFLGVTRFLSISPHFPDTFSHHFLSIPDRAKGILILGDSAYKVSKIAQGVDKCRTVHFYQEE